MTNKKISNKDRILAVFGSEPLTRADVSEKTGLHKDNVGQYLVELVELGQLTREKKADHPFRRPYLYSVPTKKRVILFV